MQASKADLSMALKLEQLQRNLDAIQGTMKDFYKLAEGSKELRELVTNQITQYALSVRASKLDKDELENFFKFPYVIIPGKHEAEFYLAIPKFVDAQFGYLHKVTESFNIFLVNRYVDWLGELPEAIKKELNMPDPLDVYFDGTYLVGPDIKKAKEKYGKYIKGTEKGKLLVDKSRHFELLANLIKDGILPFVPKPVPQEDMVERRCDFELRDYQKDAWEEFLTYSNIGVFFPPSTGKTFLGIYGMTHIKGPHLVAVPTRTLIEQWEERIELYTDLTKDDVEVMTYHRAWKQTKKYKLVIVDEVHHLPANEFSKMATIPRDYFMGLSATPQREDNREEYIFALSGKPVGLAWPVFKKLGIIQNPTMNVWILKNEVDKMKRLATLLEEQKKTIIFSDSIELGRIVSKRFNIPHIYAETKQRLVKIHEALCSVVSRVGDEGISLPDIERVIEISWLYGSRRQELQRFTRLLHGQGTKGEGHILMTVEEYQRDHKRLFGIMDKGFKIVLHREGVSEKMIQKPLKHAQQRRPTTMPNKPITLETNHPILSMPGIQKQLITLNTRERNFINLLFQREGKPVSKEAAAMLLGFSSTHSFEATLRFKKLEDMKLIQKEGKSSYKADLTLMGFAK